MENKTDIDWMSLIKQAQSLGQNQGNIQNTEQTIKNMEEGKPPGAVSQNGAEAKEFEQKESGISQAADGAAKGGMIGGPWGAVIGAAIGLGKSILGERERRRGVKYQAKANEKAIYGQNAAQRGQRMAELASMLETY